MKRDTSSYHAGSWLLVTLLATTAELMLKGTWCYLYRAIDRDGNLVDSMLSEKRDMEAAKRFDLRKLSTWWVMPQNA